MEILSGQDKKICLYCRGDLTTAEELETHFHKSCYLGLQIFNAPKPIPLSFYELFDRLVESNLLATQMSLFRKFENDEIGSFDRQIGRSTLILVYMIWKALENTDLSYGILCHSRVRQQQIDHELRGKYFPRLSTRELESLGYETYSTPTTSPRIRPSTNRSRVRTYHLNDLVGIDRLEDRILLRRGIQGDITFYYDVEPVFYNRRFFFH